jgi:hypothetical protein
VEQSNHTAGQKCRVKPGTHQKLKARTISEKLMFARACSGLFSSYLGKKEDDENSVDKAKVQARALGLAVKMQGTDHLSKISK